MRARAGLVLAVGLACGGAAAGFEPPAAEDWLPKMHKIKPGTPGGVAPGWRQSEWIEEPKAPPSAFSELVLPEHPPGDPHGRRAADLVRLCPRLSGKLPLKIEPNDDTLRKLLKARIHQNVLALAAIHEDLNRARTGPWTAYNGFDALVLDSVQAVAELWSDEPKERSAWLSELVIVAKERERYTWLRVVAFALAPEEFYAASRVRLKIEAELWKVKNPK